MRPALAGVLIGSARYGRGVPSLHPRSGRGFIVLFALVLALLLVTLAAAFVLPAPWSWLVGWTYLGWDTWLLLRLMSAARAATAVAPEAARGPRPTLAVLIAARNEITVLPATLAALLAQDEPAESILVVDDGSHDGSVAWLERTWALTPGEGWRASASMPSLRVLSKANSGKADSLNRALAVATQDVIVTLDADTVPAAGAFRALRDAFADPALVAAGGVLTPECRGPWRTVFALYQRLEYLRSFLWRAVWVRDDCLLLLSGAFAAIRREPLSAVGGFDATSPVEDYELMFRLHRWSVAQHGRPLCAAVVPRARATTDAPAGVGAFLRQRRRWFAGFLITLIGNRDLVGDARFAQLGRVHLRMKTVDMLLPLYGLAALVALGVLLARDGRIAPVVLMVLTAKFALDAGCAAWCVIISRRWLGDRAGLGVGAALLAALSEPFAFQLLRQAGAALGWLALLRGRIEWSPGRLAARSATVLLLAGAALGADPAAARDLKRAGRLPEAEVALAAASAERPDDVDLLIDLATVRGWRGNHREAIATWRAVLAKRPRDPEVGIGLARALWWGNDATAAEAVIASLLPPRHDAPTWILGGDIAAAAGDLPTARKRYARAVAIDPAGDGAARLARTVPPRRWRVDAGTWRERFSGPRGEEGGTYASVGVRLAPGYALTVGSERQVRATAIDWRHAVEVYLHPLPRLDLYLRGAVTPGNQFLPDRDGELDGSWHLIAPLDLLAGVRVREYPEETLATWRPGLRWRALPGLTLAIRSDTTTGGAEPLHGGEARVELDLPHAVRPYLGFALGEEVEPPEESYRTRTAAGGVVIMLEPAFGLRLDAALDQRGDLGWSARLGFGAIVAF